MHGTQVYQQRRGGCSIVNPVKWSSRICLQRFPGFWLLGRENHWHVLSTWWSVRCPVRLGHTRGTTSRLLICAYVGGTGRGPDRACTWDFEWRSC